MDQYRVFAPKSRGTFQERVGELYLQLGFYLDIEELEGRHLCDVKVFLSDAINQYPLLIHSELFIEQLSKSACTIIEQPPVDQSKITLLIKTSTEKETSIFQSLRLGEEEAIGKDAYSQTLLLFRKYLKTLEHTNLSLPVNLIRTWIYVTDIDVNYEGVVKARNAIFREQGLTPETHYIASTGIGGRTPNRHALVGMDFLTLPGIQETDKQYLKALNHLNPTDAYGVAFERGTKITFDGYSRYFISGTASIDEKGEVLYPGDVTRQTARLLENIGALLGEGGATMNDIRYFIVYLRDASDAITTEAFLQTVYPHIPHLIVQAQVCRPEWLIEMECIAEKKTEK